MDWDSEGYKVFVVGSEKQGGGDVVAKIFNSMTRKWNEPNIFLDFIFGWLYRPKK